MRAPVRAAVGAALGDRVTDTRPLSGGDINDAYRVTLASGRAVFVKTNDGAHPRMFPCEARGLSWLAEAASVRVPDVLAVTDERADGPHFLVLELIEAGAPARDFGERLGRGLAGVHVAGADFFGLAHDNFIATLEQANGRADSWPEFYAQRRLLPLARMAVERGLAPTSWRGRFAALTERMTDVCGPVEPPARLHGDLWHGNVHHSDRGPVLIDPAVYGGPREVDLAMLALFGGVDHEFLAGYQAEWPLQPGFEARLPLWQLYPLLVHVVLFGGGYVGAVDQALADLGA